MKKFLFLGALAALLLGTASCANDMEPNMVDDGTVMFKIELPGNIDSRAIADGTTATKLEVACYDAQGNKLPVQPTVKTDFVNREATVTYKLVKGQTYNFSFFAHAANAPYTFDAGTKLSECTFTVDNYTGACNDEKRDAFYAVLTDYEVTATETTVTLIRPFAQLNFGADDLAAAAAAGIIPSQSMVTVSNAATTFNLSTGAASGEAAVAFTLADLPSDPETLVVEDTDYRWIEMCYFLVPNNEANVDVEMTVTTKDANDVAKADVVVPVANVPVKKNHRTNIVGSLFTQAANFRVIIDQNFDEDINYNVVSVSSASELLNAVLSDGTIIVENNIDLGSEELHFTKNNTVILNGTITAQSWSIIVDQGADVTFEGNGGISVPKGCLDIYGKATIKGGTYTTSLNTSGTALYVNPTGELILDDANVNAAFYAMINENKMTINGGTIKSTSKSMDGNWAYCVRNMSGTFIMNGGWIDGIQGALAVDGGDATINDGYLTTHDYYENGVAKGQNHYAVFTGNAESSDDGSVVINGGYFYVEPTRNLPCIYNEGTDGASALPVTVNGGYFNNLGLNNFLEGQGVTALDQPIQDAEHNANYSYGKQSISGSGANPGNTPGPDPDIPMP